MDLADLIARRARVEGRLILVDDFLNHRVDPDILDAIGAEFAKRFIAAEPDLILTAEASGIPPAMACATAMRLPYVYAKKYLGTGQRYTFSRDVMSATRGVEYRVEVARRMLEPGMRVVIIDDFLSGGRTAIALGEITIEAGCELLGLGFVIEKRYEPGRDLLDELGWRVEPLVTVNAIDDGRAVIER